MGALIRHENAFVRTMAEGEACVVLHYACCTASEFARKDWSSLGYMNEGCGEWDAVRRWHRMRMEAEAAPIVPEETALALIGLPACVSGASVRQEEVRRMLRQEYDALFRVSSPEEEAVAEASVEHGTLVRVERVGRLLETMRAPTSEAVPIAADHGSKPSSQPPSISAPTQTGEMAELIKSLLSLSPAERAERLKSSGLKLGTRLRIETEVLRCLEVNRVASIILEVTRPGS